ncbi:MAG: hypothetical protein ACI9KE_001957 [Polyangiales bacterium]|jgi:hypothetical protein
MMSDFPKAGDFVGGRYKVESLLGEGGMGAVFAAVNGATGRPVAIKWMRPQMAKSAEAIARFLAEARTTARIEHPNVIQILDVGQDGDAPFLVMERLRGESLGERLVREKRIAPAEAVDIIIAACNGVAEAHSEGIVHRDLKPDNIFLCRSKDGKLRAPKVLDFGISKLFDDGGGKQQQLTETGAIMGTPLYMSPEQLDGRREPDAAFDVYAMGVVLYETLAGTTPYNADTFFILVQQIVAGNSVPLAQAAPWVPPELCAVVDRAMNPNRELRFTSMGELLAGLRYVKENVALGDAAPTWSDATAPLSTGPYAPQNAGPTGLATGPLIPPTATGQTLAPAVSEGGPAPWMIFAALGALLGVGMLVGVAYIALARNDGPVSPAVPGQLPQQPSVPQPYAPPASANAPQINLQFSGACSPRFDIGRIMVNTGSGVISITAAGMELHGSLNVKVRHTGETLINTSMITEGVIVQVMANDNFWMGIARDTQGVLSGHTEDPISGTIHARQFDGATAQADLTFENVVIQQSENGSLCTINGTLRTYGPVTGF